MKTSSLAAMVGSEQIDHVQMRDDVDMCIKWLSQNLTPSQACVAVQLRHPYWHWMVTLALLEMGKCCASAFKPQDLPSTIKARFQVTLVDELNTGKTDELAFPVEISKRIPYSKADTNSTTTESASAGFAMRLHPKSQRWLFTSGSTGQPKLIEMSALDIRDRLKVAGKQYGSEVSARTRLVHLMGIDTVGAFLLTLTTWLRGGAVLMGVPLPDGKGITKIPMERCNMLSASPATLKDLLNRTQGVWPGRDKRRVRVGGSRLHTVVRDEALQRIGFQVQTTYGATELGLVASCDANQLTEDSGAAGKVLPGVEVEVVDENDMPVAAGVLGRVRCKTSGMARGYAGEDTSDQFRHGWFYPGDIGTLTADGWLSISGRDGDVLNLGGPKVSAVDLESRLMHIDGLMDVCVVSIDGSGVPVLAIAVVHSDEVNLQALRPIIQNVLPKSLPFHLVRVPSLGRNQMGKLARTTIAEKLSKIIGSKRNSKIDKPT